MRLRLLDLLLERGDATASALARTLPITRQGIAKHLAVLERAGLVAARRAGREVRFAVRDDRLDLARRQMAQVAARWDERLVAIKRIAEGGLALQHGAVVDDELLVAVVADRRLAAHDDVAAEPHVALDREPLAPTSDGGPAGKRASKSRSSLKWSESSSTSGRPSAGSGDGSTR